MSTDTTTESTETTPLEGPIVPPNTVREIVLTRVRVAIVDAADYAEVSKHRWYCKANGDYAIRNIVTASGKRTSQFLHRFIAVAPADFQVDHINGNTLDNRRCNLRLATHAENLWNRGAQRNNTSGHKGVFLHRRSGLWTSRLYANGKMIHLGYFKSKDAAAVAYASAVTIHHGEFAKVS